MRNFVFEFFDRSSSVSQNFLTLVSSNGASTSSRIHTGAGFSRKTANISAITVSACSPPDSNDIVCGFLPGGHATMSRPAFNISSLSSNLSSAFPPSNNFSNKSLKLEFTFA